MGNNPLVLLNWAARLSTRAAVFASLPWIAPETTTIRDPVPMRVALILWSLTDRPMVMVSIKEALGGTRAGVAQGSTRVAVAVGDSTGVGVQVGGHVGVGVGVAGAIVSPDATGTNG